jgi:hypothetical protein
VKFYTNDPISIITCVASLGKKISEVVYVIPDPSNRGLGITNNYLEILNSRYSASQKIVSNLNLKISTISWKYFQDNISEVQIVDSILAQGKISHAHTIIMQSSDTYCVFGFSTYRSFLRTKIKLRSYWRKRLKYNKFNTFYFFGNLSSKINSKKLFNINVKGAKDLLEIVSSDFIKTIVEKYNIDPESRYLLVLPPSVENCGIDFVEKFFKQVNCLANEKNLKILIKPHRNDNIHKLFEISKHKGTIDYDTVKQLFSEFFFLIPNIEEIVSVPSSSLTFADYSKLTVFVPKDRKLFRRRFLDQTCFLDSIGVNYSEI